MIIVTVFLDSAIDDSRSRELARMYISNDDDGSEPAGLHRYDVKTLRGRSKDALDKHIVNRHGEIDPVPSDAHHVWHLVAEALRAVNYHKRPK